MQGNISEMLFTVAERTIRLKCRVHLTVIRGLSDKGMGELFKKMGLVKEELIREK